LCTHYPAHPAFLARKAYYELLVALYDILPAGNGGTPRHPLYDATRERV